jgi:hypothetical protein
MPEVQFRRLEEGDLPLMKRWLEDPDVAPWYGSDSTEHAALRAEYGDKIRGERRDHSFIIQIDGEDAGYIQCYVIDDHPDYARQMRIDQGAVVILTPVLPRCEQSRWDHAIDNFRYPW